MNIQTTTLTRRAIALAAVAARGLAACGSDDDAHTADDGTEQTADGVSMADPWSRQPADGQTTSAVYGELTNASDETITAISAATSVSDTVELHEVVMNDEDQMTMREKEGGFETQVSEEDAMKVQTAEQWMRTVDTRTEDFLKIRFAIEAAGRTP